MLEKWRAIPRLREQPVEFVPAIHPARPRSSARKLSSALLTTGETQADVATTYGVGPPGCGST